MNEMEALVASEEIRKLKGLYFRAMDTKLWDLLDSVFTQDVICDYRGALDTSEEPAGEDGDKDLISGLAAVKDYIRAGLTPLVSVHQGYMPEITVDSPETASGIWAMTDHLLLPDSPTREIVGYGHYHETYRKIAGNWRIATLRLTRLRVDFVSR
ncbi:MAG: nuclear transport factor 2 family protein [Parasphingorhabdus sp.]|nr:nuclear transport factor 2 family protein [Parasphingorhabdus sp.]